MSNISKLVGVVVDGIPTYDRTVRGEKFNRITVDFNGITIPVLFSEYVVTETELIGKIVVTGCLASDVKRGTIPKFYFYANTIESAEDDAEPCSSVNFELKVTKIKGFQQNKQSRDILPLVCSTGNPISGTSVIYLCLMDGAARKFKDNEVGYTITGTGDLHAFRDIYEVYADTAELRN